MRVTLSRSEVMDGNGSNSHGIRSRCHLLSHFNSDSNMIRALSNMNTKQVSEMDFYSDIYSIQLKVHIVKFNIDE